MAIADVEVPLGTPAPDFELTDLLSGEKVSRKDFEGRPLLVVFMCNHCPYVRHVESKLAEVANRYQERGVAVVAISANDPESYPDDSPEHLRGQAERIGMRFPYLYDESQEVAKAFRAVTTPDIFLYDRDHRLYYRGRFDAARPKKPTPVTGEDLINALDSLLAGAPPPEPQWPSMGCSIKWREGNAPDYLQSS